MSEVDGAPLGVAAPDGASRPPRKMGIGESVNAARGADALDEFLQGFLLGRRQRVIALDTDVFAGRRTLAGKPVLREFGRECIHDR